MNNIIKVSLVVLILTFSTQLFAQNKPNPAPVFSELLSNVYIRNNGLMKPLRTYAYFLKGDKGQLKVLRNGNEIAEFTFRIDVYTAPKYTIEGYELVKGKNHSLGLMIKEPGNYELAYYANGERFYSFPFELVIKDSGDPYKPNKVRLLNGVWNNYAYLHKTKMDPASWEFRMFMRNDAGGYKQTSNQVLVTRDSDKKLVLVGSSSLRTEASWNRLVMTLNKPGKKNAKGEYYSNQDFYIGRDKLEDGGYTATLKTDGNSYGTYKFTVKDGEIQPQGKQVRRSTDPTKFIEGGGREFWMKKQ